MTTKVVIALTLSFALYSGPSANPATIDTTGTPIGTIFEFGSPNTATYGQTFTALGSTLDSFSLFLGERLRPNPRSLDVRGYIASWNGTNATNILYESTTQTMNGAATL